MEKFQKKNFFQLKKMQLEAVEQYFVELRKYQFEQHIPLKNIEIRKRIHKLLWYIIKLERIISKEELKVIGDKRVESIAPKIYACTHIGGNDVQRTFEAIKEHAYLFLGDPKELYRDITGVILNLNGAICLETNNKEDRKIAYSRALELLRTGANLLIYPEGAWNITENLPVMGLYKGAVKMAAETGADIVPVAIEQYDNLFYVNIGENIKYNQATSHDLEYMNQLLRDKMATLKWEIWEYYGLCSRAFITEEFRRNFQQNIVDRCEYDFTIQDVYDTMYHDPNVTSPEEVFGLKKRINK